MTGVTDRLALHFPILLIKSRLFQLTGTYPLDRGYEDQGLPWSCHLHSSVLHHGQAPGSALDYPTLLCATETAQSVVPELRYSSTTHMALSGFK